MDGDAPKNSIVYINSPNPPWPIKGGIEYVRVAGIVGRRAERARFPDSWRGERGPEPERDWLAGTSARLSEGCPEPFECDPEEENPFEAPGNFIC